MFPHFNASGVIPPFLPTLPHGSPGSLAPYTVLLVNLVERFATSSERIEILNGFLRYRLELKKIGIRRGFQWIDGSFVENVETTRQRPPKDIDIVTFADRPDSIANDQQWVDLFNTNKRLFDPPATKDDYQCDAYYIDLGLPAQVIVNRTSYWHGLFSHQRESFLWKGMLKVSLSDDETECFDILDTLVGGA
nr:hypothetical protein [uncultured Desulfobulbus sp.]